MYNGYRFWESRKKFRFGHTALGHTAQGGRNMRSVIATLGVLVVTILPWSAVGQQPTNTTSGGTHVTPKGKKPIVEEMPVVDHTTYCKCTCGAVGDNATEWHADRSNCGELNGATCSGPHGGQGTLKDCGRVSLLNQAGLSREKLTSSLPGAATPGTSGAKKPGPGATALPDKK